MVTVWTASLIHHLSYGYVWAHNSCTLHLLALHQKLMCQHRPLPAFLPIPEQRHFTPPAPPFPSCHQQVKWAMHRSKPQRWNGFHSLAFRSATCSSPCRWGRSDARYNRTGGGNITILYWSAALDKQLHRQRWPMACWVILLYQAGDKTGREDGGRRMRRRRSGGEAQSGMENCLLWSNISPRALSFTHIHSLSHTHSHTHNFSVKQPLRHSAEAPARHAECDKRAASIVWWITLLSGSASSSVKPP